MGLSHMRNCATERRKKSETRAERAELWARPPAREWNLAVAREFARAAAWETERIAATARVPPKRIVDV